MPDLREALFSYPDLTSTREQGACADQTISILGLSSPQYYKVRYIVSSVPIVGTFVPDAAKLQCLKLYSKPSVASRAHSTFEYDLFRMQEPVGQKLPEKRKVRPTYTGVRGFCDLLSLIFMYGSYHSKRKCSWTFLSSYLSLLSVNLP